METVLPTSDPPAQPARRRKLRQRIGQTFAILIASVLAVICIGLGFGMPAADRQRIDDFQQAVNRWQVDPDFRQVQSDYVRLGSRAMQAHWWGVPIGRVVMGFRSIPGLGETYAINAGSASHYADFTAGPLAAYLHLTGEQGLDMGLDLVAKLAASGPPTDPHVRAILRSFNLPVPVATDRGAVQSVRDLLSDIDPAKPFSAPAPIGDALRQHIAALAPGDPSQLTFDQQLTVFARLDDRIRASDPQLWRTKQVSDFLGGIWAQGYGQFYAAGVTWLYRLRWGARIGLVLILLATVEYVRRARRRRTAMPR
jgi:hypothetical protein